MNISKNYIENLTYIYLSISLLLFLITWLNPICAVVSAAALLATLYFIIKKSEADTETINIKKRYLLIAGLISVLWCFTAGIGSFYYQSSDWHLRNAVFRDLINFSYPVIYDNGSALVYYIGQMLPAAIIGKICNFIGITHYFLIANAFNLFWSSVGIFLVILNIFSVTKCCKFWVIAVLVLFSGMDILNTSLASLMLLHIEHHKYYQYSSNTTLLFWVYNQTIAAWLVILNFIKNRNNVSKFGLYAVFMLFYSPLPFIGTVFYWFIFGLKNLIDSIRNSKLYNFITELFSVPNVLSLLIIFPIIYLYYSCNDNSILNMIGISVYNLESFRRYYRFVMCEAGLVILFMMYKYYKNLLFIIAALHLFIIPIISIPSAPDICMRVSVPSLFILMIFIIKFLSDSDTKIMLKILVTLCLMLGAITPIFEFGRGIILIKHQGIEPIIKDEIFSLNNRITGYSRWQLLTYHDYIPNYGNYKNYGPINPRKYIFYRYLSRH